MKREKLTVSMKLNLSYIFAVLAYLTIVMLGKGMNETGLRAGTGTVGTMSPDSDCNSNQCTTQPASASLLSTASSQDIDFQDNSDYQWFLDYGYRDGGTNHHTSILSLAESYDANDVHYYDAMAKNMDANLAEADMESFRTEDIHALLTNLPPMCMDHLSQENNRQGECYASVSGSMMAKFDLESSISPHSSSQGEDSANSTSMSICKSELLFSPVKDTPVLMPGANFSVDSLDCDMMLTCQANKDNYTIAFEGSMTMYSEESDYHDTDKSETSGTDSAHWTSDIKNRPVNNVKTLDTSMTQSDSGSMMTWSKLKKRGSENHLRRHPSGNNNNSGDDASHLGLNGNTAKSQSMPNLYKQKLKSLIASNYIKSQNSNSSTDTTVKRRPVRVFDIQNQTQNSSGSVSDMATSVDGSTNSDNVINKATNFSLVKLFMKQKSMSTEGMSTTMDQLSSSENWPGSQSSESACSDNKPVDNLVGSAEQKLNETSSRTYDLIAEEPEEPEEEVTGSESVEQLSESISKLDSFENSFEADEKTVNNNNNYSEMTKKPTSPSRIPKLQKIDSVSRSIQTLDFSEIASLKNADKSVKQPPPPLKVIEPSFLNKLKLQGGVEKPVYVLYPNYVLPDLDFLNDKKNYSKVRLVPQKPPHLSHCKRRPLSCNDVEMLKKRNFSHIKDWESLNFLLPPEYRQMLAEVPELSEHIKPLSSDKQSPTMSNVKLRKRPVSCDYTNLQQNMNTTNVSSSSSTATQPSSGYRGSSTILSDSQNSPAPASNLNPLFVYRYDSVTSSEASSMTSDRTKPITTMAPPLPKRCVSLPHGEYIPPRPPLPRGILRKGLEKADPVKRYSMYETSEEELTEESKMKRKSMLGGYFAPRNKRFSETEDEGVDAGASSSSLDENQETFRPVTPQYRPEQLLAAMDNDELAQLDELLKISCQSGSYSDDLNDGSLSYLRSYVSKFLSMKMNQAMLEQFGGKKTVSFAEHMNLNPKHAVPQQFVAPNNSPNVSAFAHTQCSADWPLPTKKKTKQDHLELRLNSQPVGIARKKELTYAILDSLELLADHFEGSTTQSEQIQLADTTSTPAVGKLLLENLCPVLYALLYDGLKPSIKTEFGDIANSVWQVVEASAQQGPLTKSLHDLVMKINSEDVLTEGTVKFNAFVLGLLNLRSLDAWLSYLRTRESILNKHYQPDSFLLLSHTHVGSSEVRELMDTVIVALKPLVIIPFQLDLLFEYRQLHASFMRKHYYSNVSPNATFMGSFLRKFLAPESLRERSKASSQCNSPNDTTITPPHNSTYSNHGLPDLLDSSPVRSKERPRSCIETTSNKPYFKLGEDMTNVSKKRWSSISPNSKIHQVYDRLAREDEEEYADSLEANVDRKIQSPNVNDKCREDGPESLDSNLSDEKPITGRRFKKLQQKWEMLSNKESTESVPTPSPVQTPTKSRIPRLVTSPVKPSGIPVFTGKVPSKKVTTPPGSSKPIIRAAPVKNSPAKKTTYHSSRTSRVDQLENPPDSTRHVQRPSSLPYKSASSQSNKTPKLTPPRRAVSSSLNRKPLSHTKTPKVVRTLSHRVPSESGHLSYNEGEKLKVVLEVDENWLLCCRGTQKGLVPKSAVISADNSRF